jgi:anti-sigma factor (TIGR02949 family)
MLRIRFGPIDLYGCQDALDRLDDYLDSELSPTETAKVRTHLRICRFCSKKFAFEDQFNVALREKLLHLDIPESLKDKVARPLGD